LTRRWPNASECQWLKKPGKYMSSYAMDMVVNYNVSEAQELCIQMGSFCKGISCTEASTCQVRGSSSLQTSPQTAEYSLVKDCPSVTNADCQAAFPAADTLIADREQPEDADDLHGAAIVILAHNRDASLKECLQSLLSQEDAAMFDIIVSMDDASMVDTLTHSVKQAAKAYRKSISTWHVKPRVPDPQLHNEAQIKWFQTNTGKIAHHYWSALERTFSEKQYRNAIFLEEDLIFSPDFLALFRSTAPLLNRDSSLWCVSAWNDNGFVHSFSDYCRLMRTSYFPGLGFLLRQEAWKELREMWPISPTMGWDYWMRVAFREKDKECIIPEVSRSHHASTTGSSVTKEKQFKLFKSMALAQIPSSCTPSQPCRQFGDIRYLEKDSYEAWIRDTIANSDMLTLEDFDKLQKTVSSRNPAPKFFYMPYVIEDWPYIVEMVGLRPKGTKGAIPSDIRAEHYGVLNGKHLLHRSDILLVDKRDPRRFLPEGQRLQPPPETTMVKAAQGSSCAEACTHLHLMCDPDFLYLANTCQALKKRFPCEQGCAHQVGKELPVYVPDAEESTYRQCLVSFISKLNCDGKHKSTARLCVCVPMRSRQRGSDDAEKEPPKPSLRHHQQQGYSPTARFARAAR